MKKSNTKWVPMGTGDLRSAMLKKVGMASYIPQHGHEEEPKSDLIIIDWDAPLSGHDCEHIMNCRAYKVY